MESKSTLTRKDKPGSGVANRIPPEVQFMIYAHLASEPAKEKGCSFGYSAFEVGYKDDRSAFKPFAPEMVENLMLVSKSWCDVGRSFMFHTVTLIYGNGRSKIRMRSLSENPYLAMHIRNLKVNVLQPLRYPRLDSFQALEEVRHGRCARLGAVRQWLSTLGLAEATQSQIIHQWIKVALEPRLSAVFEDNRSVNSAFFKQLFARTPRLGHVSIDAGQDYCPNWHDVSFDKLLRRHGLSKDMFSLFDALRDSSNPFAVSVMEDLAAIMPSTVKSLRVYGIPDLEKRTDPTCSLGETHSHSSPNAPTGCKAEPRSSWGLASIERFEIRLDEDEMQCDHGCSGARLPVQPCLKADFQNIDHQPLHLLSYWCHQLNSAQNLTTLEISSDNICIARRQPTLQDPLELLLRFCRGPNVVRLISKYAYLSKDLIQLASSLPKLRSLQLLKCEQSRLDPTYDFMIYIKGWLLEAASPSLTHFKLRLKENLAYPSPIDPTLTHPVPISIRWRIMVDDWADRYLNCPSGAECDDLLKIGAELFNSASLGLGSYYDE